MQARENTVKTVGMYKETMKLLLRCTNKRAFPHKGKAFRRTTVVQNKKYRAVQTTRYLKSYWVS